MSFTEFLSKKILMKQKLIKQMKLLKIKKNEEQKNAANETFSVDEMTSKDFHNDLGAHIDIIGSTLRNKTHWDTYRDVILFNRHIFRGRTVLNINCGVGLLSLFAARAGAAQVFAVDNSNATDYAARVVNANQLNNIIKVFKSPLNELELPVQEVDIIICDWMGYSLLFQSQCVDVIYARDKWLKKSGGHIFPDIAKLYMAGLENANRKYSRIDWWYNVQGFNMQAMRNFALTEPSFQQVHQAQILSTAYELFRLNLNTATLEDLKFRSKFVIRALCDGEMDGIFTYFEVAFSSSHTPEYLRSDPLSPPTRWCQTVYFFDEVIKLQKDQDFYGGFEMYALKEGDLNVMEAGCEMFSGHPDECFQLEAEMRWRLKASYMNEVVEENSSDATIQDDTEAKCQVIQLEQVAESVTILNNNLNEIKVEEPTKKWNDTSFDEIFPKLPAKPELVPNEDSKPKKERNFDQQRNKNQYFNKCQYKNKNQNYNVQYQNYNQNYNTKKKQNKNRNKNKNSPEMNKTFAARDYKQKPKKDLNNSQVQITNADKLIKAIERQQV